MYDQTKILKHSKVSAKNKIPWVSYHFGLTHELSSGRKHFFCFQEGFRGINSHVLLGKANLQKINGLI